MAKEAEPQIHPHSSLTFLELKPFTKRWSLFEFGDEDLRRLQLSLLEIPALGPPVPRAGGLRKLRFAKGEDRRGKRGSYRIYYVYIPSVATIILAAIFAKNESADLSQAERDVLAGVIERIRTWLESKPYRATHGTP